MGRIEKKDKIVGIFNTRFKYLGANILGMEQIGGYSRYSVG